MLCFLSIVVFEDGPYVLLHILEKLGYKNVNVASMNLGVVIS